MIPRAMFTDLYAFTMAAAYVRAGKGDQRVTCEMFTRRLPRNRRYMVAAGLSDVVHALADWAPTEGDLAFLRSLPAMKDVWTDDVLERFRRIRFGGDVWAMPDGTVFFPDEPVLRITAPVIEAQLVETFVLSVFNHAASIASKAARVVQAAGGKPVLEFGMRRVHPDASVTASKIAYATGLSGTSNVAAAQAHDIPLAGTMAHAFVMVHDAEEEAFRAFVAAYPNKAVLLVDTYNTLEGVRRAIRVAGKSLGGIRIDSGDLATLARESRALLDAAGLQHVRIVVSGDLDEHKVEALRKSGAPVDTFAVGTELAASADAPTLGAVYKVVHDHASGRSVAKFASGKGTLAGVHQVLRTYGADGRMQKDTIALADEPTADATPLLKQVMRDGAVVGHIPWLEETRSYTAAQLATLPDHLRGLGPEPFEPHRVGLSAGVKAATEAARSRHTSS